MVKSTNLQKTGSNHKQRPIVEIENVTYTFGKNKALKGVNLNIPEGGVFGLVGVNGAGKTTLIKHILGLYKVQSGTVSVFNLDPVANPEDVLSRIGYMSETTELPGWMTIFELMNYVGAFYPVWDKNIMQKYLEVFELDGNKKVREHSKGQRARIALLLAICHHPDILILDEPSSGLDPLVRKDILYTMKHTVVDEGHTVLFSSHLLDEVEQIADSVAIIDSGEIVVQGNLEKLKQQYHHIIVKIEKAVDQPPSIKGASAWSKYDNYWSTIFKGPLTEALELMRAQQMEIHNHETPNLEQLFIALVGYKHTT